MKNGNYILVKAPDNYPGKKYRNRYIYEHHLVWWLNTGQIISDDFIIHHKNHNKHDNNFSNLEIQTRADHTREHQITKSVPINCSTCGKVRLIKPGRLRYKRKCGQVHFYCTRNCQHLSLRKTVL